MASFLTLVAPQARVLAGHPWVFGNELERLLGATWDGQGVELRDVRGRSLGSGIFNAQSQIAWRRYSRQVRPFDADFLREAIRGALSRRPPETVQRLVWSEADQIPGLVVDRYGDTLVVQALTLAVDLRLPVIQELLLELVPGIVEIVLRNDAGVREREGMTLYTATHTGKPYPPQEHLIDGLRYRLDLQGGQKTGFYLDQRPQHRRVAALAKGQRVLDAFCCTGPFALQCAAAGAAQVTAIDSSAEAIASLQANAQANHLAVTAVQANVFDWFREHREERYDVIILDPPGFAPNRRALDGALRGYKEINLRALKLLTPGGLLATYSCSQAVSLGILADTLRQAAADAHRELRLIETVTQPLDHPTLLTFPESEYLKGLIVQTVG